MRGMFERRPIIFFFFLVCFGRPQVDHISVCGVFVLIFESCEEARLQQDVLLPRIDQHYWPLRRMIGEAPFLVTDQMIRDLLRDDSAQTLQFVFALLYDVRRKADGTLMKCYARQSAGITHVQSTQGLGKALLTSRSTRKLESVDPSVFHQLFDGQSYAPVFISTEQQLIQYALRCNVHTGVVTVEMVLETARRLVDALLPRNALPLNSPHARHVEKLAATLLMALMDYTPFLASHHPHVLQLLQDARRQVSIWMGEPAYLDALQHHPVVEVAAIFRKETACSQLGSNAQRVHVKVHAQCAVCRQSGPGLKHCARCRKSFYCGKEHQRQHWPVHRQSCLADAVP